MFSNSSSSSEEGEGNEDHFQDIGVYYVHEEEDGIIDDIEQVEQTKEEGRRVDFTLKALTTQDNPCLDDLKRELPAKCEKCDKISSFP